MEEELPNYITNVLVSSKRDAKCIEKEKRLDEIAKLAAEGKWLLMVG